MSFTQSQLTDCRSEVYQLKSMDELVGERNGDVKAVTQENQLPQIFDRGLDDSVVDDLEKQADNLIGTVGQLQGLDILPIIVFKELKWNLSNRSLKSVGGQT